MKDFKENYKQISDIENELSNLDGDNNWFENENETESGKIEKRRFNSSFTQAITDYFGLKSSKDLDWLNYTLNYNFSRIPSYSMVFAERGELYENGTSISSTPSISNFIIKKDLIELAQNTTKNTTSKFPRSILNPKRFDNSISISSSSETSPTSVNSNLDYFLNSNYFTNKLIGASTLRIPENESSSNTITVSGHISIYGLVSIYRQNTGNRPNGSIVLEFNRGTSDNPLWTYVTSKYFSQEKGGDFISLQADLSKNSEIRLTLTTGKASKSGIDIFPTHHFLNGMGVKPTANTFVILN